MYRQSLKTFTIAIGLCLVNTAILKAQHDQKRVRPAQITLITPIGTNGTASDTTLNNFSINLLWGSSGGVLGTELGGLWNQTHGPVLGAQFAGLGNLNAGKIIGAQFAGLINISTALFKGIQVAGLINLSAAKTQTFHEGVSVRTYSTGAQISGLMNINPRSIEGLQAAGLLNLQTDTLSGAQVAGLANTSKQLQGIQIAGILNKTKKLSGVQIGLINIADTIEKGVQVGLINIVKNGYRAIEAEHNESFYINLNYKMGTQRLYSIFSLAFKERNGKSFWATGFGLGSAFSLGQKVGFNIDAISYMVNEDEWWTDELNILNKLKINGSYQLAHHLIVYGGASVNVLISGIEDAEGNLRGSLLKTPLAFFDEVYHKTSIIIYPGLHAGIRF